jgi:hypothetical protein
VFMGANIFSQFKHFLALSSTLIVVSAVGQNIEFGVYGGVSNYIGDVSEQKMRFDQFHPSAAVMGRYNVSQRLTFKGMIAYGKVSGADSLASKAKNKIRNTNFHSDIYEFSVHAEYNLIPNKLSGRGGKPFVPYIFGGIGIFHFNPKTEFQGNIFELQPLGTEGQGTTQYNNLKKYDLTTICIPMGIGLKKRVSQNFVVGVEAGVRFTFTKYLDDVGGKYANANVVARAYGPTAGSLANRTGEVSSDYPGIPVAVEGNLRTTPGIIFGTDMYFLAGFSISYIFQNTGMLCPRL